MEKKIDRIIKISLYLLVFLLPIFSLPLTNFPAALNKQLLLAGICFLVFVLWLVKAIKLGKVNLIKSKLNLAVLILLIVLGISTFFSIARTQSFWGMSVEPDTLLNFILYGLVFFLFSNLISKKEVLQVIKIFLLSSGILALLFLIKGFNPIGSAQALAVFFGGAFVVLIVLMVADEKFKTDKLAWVIGSLLFINILLINFRMAWLGIIFAMVAVLWIKLKSFGSRKGIELKDYILPLVIFAIALMFLFIKLPLGNILDLPSEVNLSYGAGFNIAKKTLEEGTRTFIFGSGPTTFGYKYSLHRSIALNLTEFWSLRFAQASSALITFLTTSGILGILAVLFLMAMFFYQFFKGLSAKISKIQVVVFIGSFYFLVLWFFYSINFSLMFAGFLMLGLYSASLNKRKEISLVNPPEKAFFSMLGTVILIVILVAGFYIYTQKYSAALSFSKGLDLLNSEQPDLEGAIVNINRAGNLAKTNDKYFRNLSQTFLFKITEILNNQELSPEERQARLRQYIPNAQKVVQKAVEVNPKNSLNWMQAGRVYENLMPLADDASQLAVFSYKKAGELDPQNPQIFLNLGRIYKSGAQKIQQSFNSLSSAEKKDEDRKAQFRDAYIQATDLAIDRLQKSIELKSNFIPAYQLLIQVYEMKGDKEAADRLRELMK